MAAESTQGNRPSSFHQNLLIRRMASDDDDDFEFVLGDDGFGDAAMSVPLAELEAQERATAEAAAVLATPSTIRNCKSLCLNPR